MKRITSKITYGETIEQQTDNKQITTNKNDKNAKNEEEINNNINEMSSNINNDIAKIDKLMIECLNTTNTNNIMECTEYLEKMPIEVIEYALKKTARISQPNWKYAMSILDSYVQKNIDTLEKAKADDLNFRTNNNKKGQELTKEEREKKLQERIERAKKRLEEEEKCK